MHEVTSWAGRVSAVGHSINTPAAEPPPSPPASLRQPGNSRTSEENPFIPSSTQSGQYRIIPAVRHLNVALFGPSGNAI